MCVCLGGKHDFWGPDLSGPQTPGRMRSAKEKMKKNHKPGSRCHQLNLSLTESELFDIKRRAEALGMRPVHFSRAVLLDGTAAVVIQSDTFTPALVRLGNNLNQLVRKLHETGLALPTDLVPLLQDIRVLIARIPE